MVLSNGRPEHSVEAVDIGVELLEKDKETVVGDRATDAKLLVLDIEVDGDEASGG